MSELSHLTHIATQILDGSDVDWIAEMQQTIDNGSDTGIVNNLKIVDSIARSLRSQGGDESNDDLLKQLHETFDPLLASSKGEPLTQDATWGSLELRDCIGKGAFANVYRAWDPDLQREVALKLFRSSDTSIQQRMLKEGRHMARIDHANVVKIYAAEQHEGRVGLRMEMVEGSTMEALVEQALMDTDQATSIGLSLCKALGAVHSAGLMHGDIKATNVIRKLGHGVMLADFGSGIDLADISSEDRVSGTPLYLAPEVLDGSDLSVQSDIYSLGVLLFYMVSGSFPYLACSVAELKSVHEAGRKTSLLDLQPSLPDRFRSVVEKAISNDPNRRYQSMGEFSSALAETLKPTRSIAPSGRWRKYAAVSLLIVLLATWYGQSIINKPVTAVAATYQLDTRLFRYTADVDDSGNTQVNREVLSNGDRVKPGDLLSLEITANTDIHVYIFNEDERGHSHALYPLSQFDSAGILVAGNSHPLPGQGYAWQVDSIGGIERIHIISSPDEIGDIQRLYKQLPQVQPIGTNALLLKARGIGSVSAIDNLSTVSVTALAQAGRALAGQSDSVEGIQYRVIELQNP